MTAKAGIYRQAFDFETHFTQVPNKWLRDPNLSMKAKGLLVYLMSHEVGYNISLGQIEREMQDGKSAVRAAIDELKEAGYLKTEMTRDKRGYNAGLSYVLQEPLSENPTLENPTLDNQTAYREQNLTREENFLEKLTSSTNNFDEFWEAYPRKVEKRKAQKAYQQALQSASHQEIVAGALQYRNDPQRDPAFTKHPSTWLNGGCWEDEPLPQRLSNVERKQAEQDRRRDQATQAFYDAFQPKQLEIESDTKWGELL